MNKELLNASLVGKTVKFRHWCMAADFEGKVLSIYTGWDGHSYAQVDCGDAGTYAPSISRLEAVFALDNVEGME